MTPAVATKRIWPPAGRAWRRWTCRSTCEAEYAACVTDIQVRVRRAHGRADQLPIAAQVAATAKALNLVKLQCTPNADANVAAMFWNHPAVSIPRRF